MRAVSTNEIFDESKSLIIDLYTHRYLEAPARATAEIRMYHIPISVQTPPNKQLIKDEVELLSEKQYIPEQKKQCPTCGQARPLYGERTIQCLECWSIAMTMVWKSFPTQVTNFQQIVQTSLRVPDFLQYTTKESWFASIIAATVREVVASTRLQLQQFKRSNYITEQYWSSPKKNFLAAEIGCVHCGYTLPFQDQWIWSADTSDWTNGFCPSCKLYDEGYQTVWGMPSEEYAMWQDQYSTPKYFHRTIARYGALALLLVSTSHEWVKYIKLMTPRTIGTSNKLTSKFFGHVDAFRHKAKTLQDLGIKLGAKPCLHISGRPQPH